MECQHAGLASPMGRRSSKAKALERLKGDSEAAEQRKKVTVRLAAALIISVISTIPQGAAHWMAGRSPTCRGGGSRVKDAKRVRGLTEGQGVTMGVAAQTVSGKPSSSKALESFCRDLCQQAAQQRASMW